MCTAININGLTKTYRKRRAVDDLRLRVPKGDVYGFLGPNGAGKSTTIRMLTGLVRPDSGSAEVLGYDIGSRHNAAMKSVGVLVESPAFYSYLSARDNLRILTSLSGGCDLKKIDEALDMVGLLNRADDKVKSYSHGMRQRLGIAQALLPDPKLIILDEPTNGLDPQGMKDVRELVRFLADEKGVTVFLSSHLLHEVEQTCSRVGIVNSGKLIAEGEVGELLGGDSDEVEFKLSDVRRGAEVLSSFSKNLMVNEFAGRISVSADCGKSAEMNRALVQAGIEVFEMVPHSVSLESLFLNLTGEGGID